MDSADFVVVGSSGGGGTIAWLLAKAGFRVVVLEQGPDLAKQLDDDPLKYNAGASHDEYRYRLERPDPKRRPRGDYNTFRRSENDPAAPFAGMGGWTGSVLGGGSVLWGTWSFRALPIDFRLATHFGETGQLEILENEGYAVVDWPIPYKEMEPFYNVAETLLAVSGDRVVLNRAIAESGWYEAFEESAHFRKAGNWTPHFPFPCPPYPRTPVGHFIFEGMKNATQNGRPVALHPVPLPTGIVNPGTPVYKTRQAIGEALAAWGGKRPGFWNHSAGHLWSDRVRDACNLCGFCGEYLCWGKEGPKSGSRVSTLKELKDLPNAEIRTEARAYEVIYDPRLRRATGVRYLDVSDPDHPNPQVQKAEYVIVSCGAVQTARLLLMSGPPGGLGNRFDQVGRYACFHLFGYTANCWLPTEFQGYLRGELGHTGNVTSFAHYFVDDADSRWWKAGILASTAMKNPLENADRKLQSGTIGNDPSIGVPLLREMERYALSLQLRLTGDDLPMARNRVDLDPRFVDEYGFPVARITRDFGPAELRMFELMKPKMRQVFQHYVDIGLINNADDPSQLRIDTKADVKLVGDHQMGTCRMGEDPARSVLDPYCRLHDVPNVFVVDSSYMPSGLGLNPMVSVVANALRVGTWIVEESKRGRTLVKGSRTLRRTEAVRPSGRAASARTR